MNWLTKALSSSVGKKFVMGITGLFLCFFLVVHLAGNVLLFTGPEKYDQYAHALHDNAALLVVAQVILYLAFAAHIYLAVVMTQENRAARARRYAEKQTKIESRRFNFLGLTPDSTMFVTGAIVLGFTIVHLIDFKFELRNADRIDGLEPYGKAALILNDPATKIIYGIGCVFLGVHLSHGFASAFQSLGLNHPKYNRWIETAGLIFSVVIAVGFLSFLLWSFEPGGTPGDGGASPAVPSVGPL